MNPSIEHVLLRVARKLNEQEITWALGGSMLLYYYGIVDTVQDLDILIAEKDEQQVRSILKSLGTILPKKDTNHFVTKVFIESVIDEVEIDVIGGFTIVHNEQTYYCPLHYDDIIYKTVKGITIALDSLDNWHRYYHLMNRHQRAESISRYLKQ